MSKVTFAQVVQSSATALDDLIDSTDDIVKAFFDRGYNVGGADPLVDADFTSLGITAANISSFITLAQQLSNFRSNLAVTQGDYQATLNKLRTDI